MTERYYPEYYRCIMCDTISSYWGPTTAREKHLIAFHRVSVDKARKELAMRMFKEES